MLADKLHGTDPEDVIINAFKLLDPDNKGLLPKAELDIVLKSQSDRFSEAELEQLYTIAPVDAEGMVDYKGDFSDENLNFLKLFTALCYIIAHGQEEE